ncbi:MAG: hypothetical protein RJA07_1957 [Bacteroidota bacterium]|jgi:hypothetical protein
MNYRMVKLRLYAYHKVFIFIIGNIGLAMIFYLRQFQKIQTISI